MHAALNTTPPSGSSDVFFTQDDQGKLLCIDVENCISLFSSPEPRVPAERKIGKVPSKAVALHVKQTSCTHRCYVRRNMSQFSGYDSDKD